MNWDRGLRRFYIRDFLLSNFPGLIHYIDESSTISPSQVVEWANHIYKQRGEDKHAKEGNVSVAFGCLAGIILLYFQQFLVNDMMPKLKSNIKVATEKNTDELSSNDLWSGLEDELLAKIETKLSEWGSEYGVSKAESRLLINSLVYDYSKSECTKLFHKGIRPAGREVFLYEENFRKYTNYCEPVAMWLCSPMQNSLLGLLEGFFHKVLEEVLENEAKGWNDL